MIRHIVLFKFKPEADGRDKAENVRMTREMLDALPPKIPEILRSETHSGATGANPANADLILISDFESFETLQKYLVDPNHVAVGEFMRPLRESRSGIDLIL